MISPSSPGSKGEEEERQRTTQALEGQEEQANGKSGRVRSAQRVKLCAKRSACKNSTSVDKKTENGRCKQKGLLENETTFLMNISFVWEHPSMTNLYCN